MNALNKKSLHLAVLAGLAAVGAAGTAEAVHVNPDGLGQVMIYPYYTARAGHFTAVSLINTTTSYKVVKVRFLEGKNSREVLDFNLFLSPSDVWTGAVVATDNGARLISNDNSCVTPSDLFTEARTDTLGLPLNAFKNYAYTGAAMPAEDNTTFKSLDRTREGYFEVLEMGVIIPGTNATSALVAGYMKHSAAGVPANCGALDAYDGSTTNATKFPNQIAGAIAANTILWAPTGGLAGRASIINSATGANYTFSATAVDAWSNIPQYSAVGSLTPSLTSGTIPTTSSVFASYAGVPGVISADWLVPDDAISAALMRNAIVNEFVLDAGTASLTDWVVTFPTKAAYVGVEDVPVSPALRPFALNFEHDGTKGSCDSYNASLYNREESAPPPTTLNPSPTPPGVGGANSVLCWEANVIAFGASSLLGSTNTNPLDPIVAGSAASSKTTPGSKTTPSLAGTQGPNGWMSMNFSAAVQSLTPVTATFASLATPMAPTALAGTAAVHHGLPVVGMMLHNYKSTGVVSLYGGVIDHKYSRLINATP